MAFCAQQPISRWCSENYISDQLKRIGDDLQQTFSRHISRYYNNPNALPKEIHVFMDTRKAYGAVAYICQGGQPLLISKTCVVLIKESALPKLDLMTAVMHQAVRFIVALLTPQYSDIPVFLWSNSQTVLCWILNQRKLQPFVASCIQEINNSVSTNSWRYCPTQDNAVDILTREITHKTLAQFKLWEHTLSRNSGLSGTIP